LHAPQGAVNPSPPSPFPGQTSEQQAAPQQPPSPTQSAPSPMPPPSRSGNNPRDAKTMQPPRDGAVAGHQAQGTERLSGRQSFPANVIPAGSQGQPFRGPPGQQGEGDAARPAERTLADMTEEDFERFTQLQKDNKELSECVASPNRADPSQRKSTTKSKSTTLKRSRRSISCKTPLPTSACRSRERRWTTPSTRTGSSA
jgi:hypothetical protein